MSRGREGEWVRMREARGPPCKRQFKERERERKTEKVHAKRRCTVTESRQVVYEIIRE